MDNQKLQKSVFYSAIIVSVCAIIRVSSWPIATPMPKGIRPEMQDHLVALGWQARASIPAESRVEVSNAEGYEFLYDSNRAFGRIELSLVPVRVRGARYLDLEKIRDYLTGLSLESSVPLVAGGQSFLKSVDEQNREYLYSCLVGARALARPTELGDALGGQRVSVLDRLKNLAGLQLPRDWSCVYVQIGFKDGASLADNKESILEFINKSLKI